MWSYAGSAQAFAFHGRLAPRERKRLLAVLNRMAEHPPLNVRAELRDEAGRELGVWRDDGFEILFWADHFARELRIVEIDFAKG
jgi:hypothetical protein